MTHSSPSSAPHLRWSAWTDRGKVRANNEDAYLGLRFDARELHHLGRVGGASLETMDFVFAVSDGMGGALAGEYASRIAVDKITHRLPRAFRHSAAGLQAGFSEVLEELFDDVHRALAFLGGSYEECEGMETTLSLCWFTPGWLHFGHIGDSRIYYLSTRDGKLRQISHDDTHVGWLLRNGKITEYEARTHPRRNVLQKALGGGNQFVSPHVGSVGLEPGDVFLLCSDGLSEGLPSSDLEAILQVIRAEGVRDTTAQQLVNTSVERDGRDNTTALLIQVDQQD